MGKYAETHSTGWFSAHVLYHADKRGRLSFRSTGTPKDNSLTFALDMDDVETWAFVTNIVELHIEVTYCKLTWDNENLTLTPYVVSKNDGTVSDDLDGLVHLRHSGCTQLYPEPIDR